MQAIDDEAALLLRLHDSSDCLPSDLLYPIPDCSLALKYVLLSFADF